MQASSLKPPDILLENSMMNNDLPHDAVERVREIRNRHYEETKSMTREEKQAYDRKRIDNSVAEFEKRMANIQPDYDRFPFLRKTAKPNV